MGDALFASLILLTTPAVLFVIGVLTKAYEDYERFKRSKIKEGEPVDSYEPQPFSPPYNWKEEGL